MVCHILWLFMHDIVLQTNTHRGESWIFWLPHFSFTSARFLILKRFDKQASPKRRKICSKDKFLYNFEAHSTNTFACTLLLHRWYCLKDDSKINKWRCYLIGCSIMQKKQWLNIINQRRIFYFIMSFKPLQRMILNILVAIFQSILYKIRSIFNIPLGYYTTVWYNAYLFQLLHAFVF